MVRLDDRAPKRIGAAAGFAAAAYWLPAAALVAPPLRRLLDVDADVDVDGVVLTFDDGPHPEGTPAILAALERLGFPAVFFLVGEQVERRPALARELVAAGHQVALHCHRHRNAMWLTPAQVRDDLRRAAAAIGEATGTPPRHYRPPYGILTAAGLSAARALGCRTVLWRREGHDWQARATGDSIARRVLRGIGRGDVVVLHDADHYSAPGSWRATLASLEPLAAGLHARGLVPRPLPDLPR